MDIQSLFNQIKSIERPTGDSFNVIVYNETFLGITKENHIVFITKSENPKTRPLSQQTNQLFLGENILCSLSTNEGLKEGVFNILVCFDTNIEHIFAFLQLTQVYIEATKTSIININSFFESLKKLFANKQQLPITELQGLYGELFFMDYLHNKGFDISTYWQSQNRMKFDFSLDESMKIEVKTTTSEIRKHKFRHEQLVSDIYDIWIISILLKKDDQGLSLYKLSEKVKLNNPSNLHLYTRITNLLNNYSKDELEAIKFNNEYSKQNIKFYCTVDIPKFQDKQPQGVSNTEYDSDLTSIHSRPIEELIEWIIKLISKT